jgi:hypothetical protein
VLLTPSDGLENGTRAELQRLAPTYVLLVGLSSGITSAVEAALPSATVISINGTDVYDMSYEVAKAMENRLGSLAGATAIVTRGDVFPDAIAVSPLACARKWPVLLTNGATGDLHSKAAAAMSELGIGSALKVGTYAILPQTVAGVGNLSGSDRYYTNCNVAQWAMTNAGLTFSHLGVTTGDKFPDALASGPYLASDQGLLLLSPLNGPLPACIGVEVVDNGQAVDEVSFIAMIEPVVGQVKSRLP